LLYTMVSRWLLHCRRMRGLSMFSEFGCYVTKHAIPTRKCGYVRWETKAVAYATRGPHVLLFSPQFLEIRYVPTGRLVQVLEGKDHRLMQSLPGSPLLVARRGQKDDKQGMSDELVELVETAPFETSRTSGIQGTADTLWDEWD
jgi:RHO1 GDP-GTP exchange protein 1/2